MAIKAPGNITFTLGGTSFTSAISNLELQAAIAKLESTNLGSTAMESIPGLPDWNGSFTVNNWTTGLDTVLYNATSTKATAVLAFTDSAGLTVTYTWTSLAYVENFQVGGAPAGVIESPISIVLSAAPSSRAVA